MAEQDEKSVWDRISDWFSTPPEGEEQAVDAEGKPTSVKPYEMAFKPGQPPVKPKEAVATGPYADAYYNKGTQPLARTEAANTGEEPKAAAPAETTPVPTTSAETKVRDRVKIKESAVDTAKGAVKGDPTPALKWSEEIKEEAYTTLAKKEYKEFDEELKQLRNDLKESKDRSNTAEVIERIGHALAQMAGGLYGAKHGVDMSGMKFDKVDWDARRKAAREEYGLNLQDLTERRQQAMTIDEKERERYEHFQDRQQKVQEARTGRAFDAAVAKFKETGEGIRQGKKLDAEAAQGALDRASRERIAALDAGIKQKAQSEKDYKDKKGSFNKALGALQKSSKAKDESKDVLRQEAEGHLIDAGMEPDAIRDLMDEKKSLLLWDWVGERDVGETAAKINQAKSQALDTTPTKTVVKKFQNKETQQTKLVYSDGSTEIVDGLQ